MVYFEFCLLYGFIQTLYVVITRWELRTLYEKIMTESQNTQACFGAYVEHKSFLEECSILTYHTALFEHLKRLKSTVDIINSQMSKSIHNEHYLTACLSSLNNLSSLLENLQLHLVSNSRIKLLFYFLFGLVKLKGFMNYVRLEILYLLENFELEQSPFILVFERLLSHLLINIPCIVF